METEKSQRPIKIIRKHLKTNDFDNDVYILNYQMSIFGIKIWREFPIYFCNEDILKDFIETAYIFDFKFSQVSECSFFDNYYFDYYIKTKNFTIYFKDLLVVMGKYKIFSGISDFIIKENKKYAPRYTSEYLSIAYRLYINDIKYGLSESLEEKTYKLMLEKN